MHASTPTPSEMLIPDLYLADQAALSETSVIECEIAARNTRKHVNGKLNKIYENFNGKFAKKSQD